MNWWRPGIAVFVTVATAVPAFSQYAPVPQYAPVFQRPTITESQVEAEDQRRRTRDYRLSRAERAALQPALAAASAGNWVAVAAALPAAEAAARGADANYVVGQTRVRMGIATRDAALQARGIDEMIASGGALSAELPTLYENQARLAYQAGDAAKAEQALNRIAALSALDPEALVRIAQYRAARSDWAGALTHYQQVFQLQRQAGRPIPEAWRQQAMAVAYQGRMGPQAISFGRELVAAFPSRNNWGDALLIYRELGGLRGAGQLDLRRLQRAAGALRSERDYVEYAELANGAGLPGEAKAVLEEGLSGNVIQGAADFARQQLATANGRIDQDRAALPGLRSRALGAGSAADARAAGDAFYGFGDYAAAAELYRAAVQKGGEDPNVVNIRLGAALALAGRRAEAESAFRAITGPRADLASFWLAWLSHRPG